jgi:hypothetical protein
MFMLPIFQITGRSAWFVASNLLTLVRLSWLPLAVLLAAQYALAYSVIHASPGLSAKALADTDAYTAATIAEALLMGLSLSVVAVAVHRIILFGDRRPGQYFAFPFGKTEFTYVLMGALSFAAVGMLGIALGSGAMLLVQAGGGDVSDLPALFTSYPFLVVAVGVPIYVAVLWLALRLAVWPPAVVANNKLSLGEAWTMSRGNALALFALLVASAIAFYALGGALLIAASKTGMAEVLDLVERGYLDASIDSKIARLLEGRVNPHVIALELATQFFVATYTVAILSYAYKALKGLDIDLPIDGQAPSDPDFAPELGVKPMGKL